jgi:hypothetical protein
MCWRYSTPAAFEPSTPCSPACLAHSCRAALPLAAQVTAFNPGALSGLMCLNTISVAWDGGLYDCDFNQVGGWVSSTQAWAVMWGWAL